VEGICEKIEDILDTSTKNKDYTLEDVGEEYVGQYGSGIRNARRKNW